MNYTIDANNLHIEDSYQVRKRDMRNILNDIHYKEFGALSNVWNRSMFSLQAEWWCHNFCYSLGLWRSHTKDVDLNYPNKWGWLYCILGCLVWVFVK